MQDIFLIGGSPSSGSTLLVKLLNQYEDILCLPETGLFAHGQNLFDLSDDQREEDLSCHLPWLLTGVKVAHALGWKDNEYDELTQHYSTAFELLRSRVDPGRNYWLIEKSPENIFAFGRYLADSKRNRVVVTSRDSLSVIQSLMRRGFTLLEGMLAWFAHSYETVQLISNYPSQVYHCTYDQLTNSPEKTTAEIIEFLGIKGAPQEKGTFINDSKRIDSSSKITDERNLTDTDTESMRMFLEISSWGLTDTSWSRSPDAAVQCSEPVNLIGLDYRILMDMIVFHTPSQGLISPTSVEVSLYERGNNLASVINRNCIEIKSHFNSSYTHFLAKHYCPCLLSM